MTEPHEIALAAETGVPGNKIRALAEKTGLPLVSLDCPAAHLLLVQTAQRLELRQAGKGAPGPVYADFVSGKAAHRRLEGIGRKQPLARAVGLKPGKSPRIIDATAGLGQDALILATLACPVTLIERSPIVAALLADAIERAQTDAEAGPIVSHMQLIQADACEYLKTLGESRRPDVIYLDPMFPKRNKSALVKKEMRLFQQLPGTEASADNLLSIALQVALQRVVVKRPANAPWLADIKPGMAIHSPNMRFDVYLCRT
jgi:16S rRNA (guanine1516-N2)-methyltransferase